MKRVSLSAKSGQGTLEYILLTALVVGIVMTIFNGPLKAFLAGYKSRQTEYTNVVSQRNMGIPLRWFGGNYPNPGDGANAGGATAGEDTAGGDTSGEDTAGGPGGPGDFQDPNANNGQGANGGDNAGGDTQGGATAGGAGAGGPGAQANNSLLNSGSTRTASNTRGQRGRTNSGEDGEGDEEAEAGPSTTGGGRRSTEVRPDGSLLTEDELANETEEQRQARIKAVESGESLREERELFGNTRRRVREGSCGDLDIKVILQIAFVIALFFLLASMLFQKRGGKD